MSYNDAMVNDNTPTKQRLQIRFGKTGALKYTGNLDVAKIWERVLRRADLPILYSKGFNTRPRIQLASALPLGITSECEYLEVSLREQITDDLDSIAEQLRAVSPAGLDIYQVSDLSIHAPAAATLVHSADYRIRFEDGIDPADLRARVEQLLARDRIVQITERRGRKQASDLRPLIFSLEVDENGDLIAHLAAGENGSLRPDVLLEYLGLPDAYVSVHRLWLHLETAR
jgi:radical SAM-linked protein